MNITAKEMRELAESTSRTKENLDNIAPRIKMYAGWGNRRLRHMFDGFADSKEVRESVIKDLKDRGFSVRYDKIQYLFGTKEIIIEW